ncbi:unnamed protein product [Zymoseptoria tritici ST99CH_3D7]|uniref:Methyltransferase domain-containing protein n=1 Tax=Zymoseptoria tritici (strain ST99CH_3D7) TaxID=1276538 RepID=A0A1X7RYK8_ZYMT9|nr:unnamed protein product [Zymoseptoria tritici ST99CH_3D7]
MPDSTTTPPSSPKPVYAPGHAASHITNHTWRTASNSTPYLLPHLHSLSTHNPHLHFLDVGAGPGTLTASIAAHLPSTATIVATDISPSVLSRASAHFTSKGLSNATTRVASVYDLASTFGEQSFDVVHTHQVLVHLTSPLSALQSMLSVCKSGGTLALREADLRMQSIHPSTPALTAFFPILLKYHASTGGSASMGTELVSLAMAAGVPRGNITATMGTWCIAAREDREAWGWAIAARCREGPMRGKAVEEGWAREEEMDGMARAWDEWVEAEDGVWGLMNGEVIIRKP